MTKEERLQMQREKLARMRVREDELRSCGYKYIAGVDEVGRGPLAGPVVAAAVVLPEDFNILGIDDSKKLSEKKREKLFDVIKENAVAYGIGMADEKTIDEINILQATKVAMRKALIELDKKLRELCENNGNKANMISACAEQTSEQKLKNENDTCGSRMLSNGVDENRHDEMMPENHECNYEYRGIDYVLFDAMKIDEVKIPQESIIKGDANVLAIAAASIIAKVTRDRMMVEYAEEYPGYAFEKNKGYGTKAHYEGLHAQGMCPIHRRSFLKNL